MARLGKIGIFCIFLVVAGYGILLVTPWKKWVGDIVTQGLQERGFEGAALQVQSVTLNRIVFDDVRLKDGTGLSLKNLSLGYSIPRLLEGKFGDLVLQDLVLEIRQVDGVWAVNGVKQGQGTFKMPEPKDIPLDALQIKNGRIDIVSDLWRLSIPVEGQWRKDEAALSLSSDEVSFESGGRKAKVAGILSDIRFQDNVWKGNWSVGDVLMPDYPLLHAKGTIEVKEQVLSVRGDLDAEGEAGKAAFSFSYPFDRPQDMKMEIMQGKMPWAGGHVSLGKTNIPLGGKKNLRLVLDIQKISVDTLMELLTGQSVEATGTISGKIPVIVKPDGTIGLEKGAMAANEHGLISLPPGVIPGEGEQIDMTRQILENFEYDGLSIDVQEQEKGGVVLLLALSGKNPKVYDGRIVKLNVRLGGDVLEFLQSNLTMFGNPESLLDQEKR